MSKRPMKKIPVTPVVVLGDGSKRKRGQDFYRIRFVGPGWEVRRGIVGKGFDGLPYVFDPANCFEYREAAIVVAVERMQKTIERLQAQIAELER